MIGIDSYNVYNEIAMQIANQSQTNHRSTSGFSFCPERYQTDIQLQPERR